MKFVPSRQLSARSGKVWKDLKREGAIVITKDCIPFCIMVPTSDATMVDDVEELVFARARKTVRVIRSEASRKGLDRLTVEEIEIADDAPSWVFDTNVVVSGLLSAPDPPGMANEGWTVIAAWFNPQGDPGHIGTVRPSDKSFDLEHGPLVSNVGGRVGVMSAKRAFYRAPSLSDVKYYYDPKQTFVYDESKINRSWGYDEQ